MKNVKYLCLTSILSLCAMFSGCGGEVKNNNKNSFANAPDYSGSNKQYTFWAYSGTCDDWYQIAGDRYVFEDGTRQTEENTKRYADAGFNVLFVDWTFPFNSKVDNFQKSKLKTVMDYAHKYGLKCFIFENNLHSLSSSKTSLIDPNNFDNIKKFESEAALTEFVRNALKDVSQHPAFYGVSLLDEPTYEQIPAWGEVYRAVKAAYPDAWVNINLLPMSYSVHDRYCEGGTEMNTIPAYRNYLNTYYEHVGQYSHSIQYDDYPILTKNRIWYMHLDNMQMVADMAKEKGMTFGKVYQTYDDGTSRREPTETDMYWQMNIGMAMGIKDHSYYYYYPVVNASKEYDETTSIVNRKGEPNRLYWILQKLHGEMQFNARALMNFEYRGLNYYLKTPVPGYMNYLGGIEKNDLLFVEDVALESEGIILTTELYDEDNDQYGYYFVNITDPEQTTNIEIDIEFKEKENIQIYNGKEVVNEKLGDGKATITLSTGQGVFVMPF